MFEIFESKKYIYWTLEQYAKAMLNLHKGRTMIFMGLLATEGIHGREGIRQVQEKSGRAYEIFLKHTGVGGDDFFQEIFTCLALVDFVGRENIKGVGFPVKKNCPADVEIIDLKEHLENDAEYDFIIKNTDDTFLKFQLKSAPEKHVGRFTSEYFIKDILSQTTKYNDIEMVLVYLLQPAIERTSTEEFYSMINEICQGLGESLIIKNVLFVGRVDLHTFEFTQVYKKVMRTRIRQNETLTGEIGSKKPFGDNEGN